MSWQKLKERKEFSGGMFVKLGDGESIEGVFRGEPHTFYSVFKDPTEHEEWAEGRSFKFKVNFAVFNLETKAYEMKVFQGGSTLSDMLVDMKEEYGLDQLFKIKRTGSGKEDTRYSILPKGALSPEQLATINALPLHKFEKKVDESTDSIPF